MFVLGWIFYSGVGSFVLGLLGDFCSGVLSSLEAAHNRVRKDTHKCVGKGLLEGLSRQKRAGPSLFLVCNLWLGRNVPKRFERGRTSVVAGGLIDVLQSARLKSTTNSFGVGDDSVRSRTSAWKAINKSNDPIEPSEQEINHV
jgi:hypothetical protein